ncbi:MAG: hypothetical protein Q8S13_06650, partial [Dehalococcoidia bacterium]|nr:hypothetical protein [Dehalococcoidia bacterium]
AADSRITHGNTGTNMEASKTYRRGVWLGAWVGALPDAQDFLRALGDIDTDAPEVGLHAAWEIVAAKRGTKDSGGNAWFDVITLLVGPPGIVEMSGYGCTVRPRGRLAIGSAGPYALGWLDGRGAWADPAEVARLAVEAACGVYPSVGPPVEVLTGPTCSAEDWPAARERA